MRLDVLWLLTITAWIIASIVGLAKSSVLSTWTVKLSLGGAMTLAILFLFDQAWTILFLHKHPGAIAFPVAMLILLCEGVLKVHTLGAKGKALVFLLMWACLVAGLFLVSYLVPQGSAQNGGRKAGP